MKQKDFPTIGVVYFNKRRGCRKLTLKINTGNGKVHISYPWFYPQKLAEKYVIDHAEWILAAKKRLVVTIRNITPETEFFTHFHSLKFVVSDKNTCCITRKNGVITIQTPPYTDICDKQIQAEIEDFIIKTLRLEAKKYIPERVAFLAEKHGFSYTGIRINKARTRWGSCNAHKNLNFSLYLMTLPFHAIDFVILHELCHTIYMNHGKDFCQKLNDCSNNRKKEIDAEIKHFSLNIFPKFTKENEN